MFGYICLVSNVQFCQESAQDQKENNLFHLMIIINIITTRFVVIVRLQTIVQSQGCIALSYKVVVVYPLHFESHIGKRQSSQDNTSPKKGLLATRTIHLYIRFLLAGRVGC